MSRFAYWVDLERNVHTKILKENLLELNDKNGPDIFLSTNDETDLALTHITNYSENYKDHLLRVFREVFYELFNMENIHYKIIEEKIHEDSSSTTIIVNLNEIRKELQEEIEPNEIKGCIKSAMEKHFDYEDIIETTLNQVIPEAEI